LQLQVLRLQAEVVAAKIDQFIGEIERQISWTAQFPWSKETIERWHFVAPHLLRQVPAITRLSQLDNAGREQASVYRRVIAEPDKPDFPQAAFTEVVARGIYYGPVYFRSGSEPHMMLAFAGMRRDAGVSVAEVSLKLVWDWITAIKVGEHGQAFVINDQDHLIAHPNIRLVLRSTDMTDLTQVIGARAAVAGETHEPVQEAEDIQGRKVLTAYAPVPKLGWLVFVELPIKEVFARVMMNGS
jgi:hypothetical protein